MNAIIEEITLKTINDFLKDVTFKNVPLDYKFLLLGMFITDDLNEDLRMTYEFMDTYVAPVPTGKEPKLRIFYTYKDDNNNNCFLGLDYKFDLNYSEDEKEPTQTIDNFKNHWFWNYYTKQWEANNHKLKTIYFFIDGETFNCYERFLLENDTYVYMHMEWLIDTKHLVRYNRVKYEELPSFIRGDTDETPE